MSSDAVLGQDSAEAKCARAFAEIDRCIASFEDSRALEVLACLAAIDMVSIDAASFGRWLCHSDAGFHALSLVAQSRVTRLSPSQVALIAVVTKPSAAEKFLYLDSVLRSPTASSPSVGNLLAEFLANGSACDASDCARASSLLQTALDDERFAKGCADQLATFEERESPLSALAIWPALLARARWIREQG